MIEYRISKNESDQRLDKALQKILREAPKSFLYKMLRKKNITLNGRKADGTEKTCEGDIIRFFLADETFRKMKGEREIEALRSDFPEIRVLYEDGDVCVFVKPQGILSQKAKDTDFSMNEWVVSYALSKGYISGSSFETFRPAVCNRLDRNTGGIMTAGMSLFGEQKLSELFRERGVEKYYYAICKGAVTESFSQKGFLKKDEENNTVAFSKEECDGAVFMHTDVIPARLSNNGELTLLNIRLHTGRTHQIRAGLAAIGHPVLGDPKYGDPELNRKYRRNRQCLFSYGIEFPECELSGVSKKSFRVGYPEDWNQFL